MPAILSTDLLINLANILYLWALFLRDALWLRTLSVTASVCLAAYFTLRPDPMWVPVCWNTVFAGLNGFWVMRLLLERRQPALLPSS